MMIGMGLSLGSMMSSGGFSPAALFAGGTEGAWYDPSDLSTLFQDSAGTTPVTASGQPVGLMLDKSGNGNHATQAISAQRPTYTEGGGLSWLAFNGLDDAMVTTLEATLGNGSRFIGVGALTEAQVGAISHIVHSGTSRMTGKTFGLCSRINGVNNLGNHYWSTQFNSGFSGIGADVYSVNKDGSTETYSRASTSDSAVNTRVSDTGTGVYYLFSIVNGTSEYGRGKMYGTVIADKALSASELALIKAYLAEKTGVTL
jgi:hypothetical protein